MKILLKKTILYSICFLVILEILVRIFHLHKDTPKRYVDTFEVEKWLPNQTGFAVTGNRRQNFSEYRINQFGFNSYHEFDPKPDRYEVALVGDSFIEGFHQPYRKSIGTMVEEELDSIQVYEYGYAGYDFADQLHLVHAYDSHFRDIDYIIFGLKFKNDLTRDQYEVQIDRLRLDSPPYSWLKQSKLLVYLQSIGALDPFKNSVAQLSSFTVSFLQPSAEKPALAPTDTISKHALYLKNFRTLLKKYPVNLSKIAFMLDTKETPNEFLIYLKTQNIPILNIGEPLSESKMPTTLVYDKHWNYTGRKIVAKTIASYINRIK